MYGYTPPQEYTDPFVEENTATTFLFSRKDLGKREKRENWIWRGHSILPHRQPEPFSYEYVLEDGHLPNLAVVHPSNDDKAAAAAPRRTRSTKRVTFSDRHSSPIDTGRSHLRPPVPESAMRRSKSLSNPTTKPQFPPGADRYGAKPLPLLPKPSTSTHSRASLERTVSEFDIEFAQWGVARNDPLRMDLAQQLRDRRPSREGSKDSTPRRSPASSIQISPHRSLEVLREGPTPSAAQQSLPIKTNLHTPPHTPPPQISPKQHPINHPPPNQQLKRRPSKFVEHLDEKPISILQIDVTEAHPRSPVKVTLPASAQPLLPTPQATPRSSVEKDRRVDSFIEEPPQPRTATPPFQEVEIKSSPLILQVGLPTHLQRQQQRLPDTPPHSREGSLSGVVVSPMPNGEDEFLMSGALAPVVMQPAAIRRAATLKVSGEKVTPVVVAQVCTAELRPVLRSPVIASGTARLIRC